MNMNKYTEEKLFRNIHKHNYSIKIKNEIVPFKRWYNLFLSNKSWGKCCGTRSLAFKEVITHKCCNCNRIYIEEQESFWICYKCKGRHNIDSTTPNEIFIGIFVYVLIFFIIYGIVDNHFIVC